MQTIREFGDFYKDALALLGEDGYTDLIRTIATKPEIGALIPGTGGFRKLRFAREGMGKRGGARVVYFYYQPERPIHLIAIYAKAEKENLTKAQQNALYALAGRIKNGE